MDARRSPSSALLQSYLSIGRIIEAAAPGAEAFHPATASVGAGRSSAAWAASGSAFIGPNAKAVEAMGDRSKRRSSAAHARGRPFLASRHVATARNPKIAGLRRYPHDQGFEGGGGRDRIVTGSGVVEDSRGLAQAARPRDDRVFIGKHRDPATSRFRSLPTSRETSFISASGMFMSVASENHRGGPRPPRQKTRRRWRSSDRSCKAVNYDSAGTARIRGGQDKVILFLERNTRIQVEHPVTEP